MSLRTSEPEVRVSSLANGVRLLTLPQPNLETACVSVFVRTGSAHESRRLNGISHFAEHMAFKGTTERDCQRINLDAERLGAEVNAHTDKDHTAYHMRGLARHAPDFVRMLGDIVLGSTFPEAELERERQVILHEYTEDDDDPMSTAFKLFDKLCFGEHAIGQPVIGTRANIMRFTRDELAAYVRRQYTGANVIVGAAGNVDADAMRRAAEAAFGAMERGTENRFDAPVHIGGIAARRLAGVPQTHVVLGFPIPGLTGDYHAAALAATLFGEGMSSPLMDEIRERRGLVYYAACSADVLDPCGQFVIEASTAPEHLDQFIVEVHRLLRQQAQRIDPVDLERARNQTVVRSLRAQEQAALRLEAAALDLFTFGRVRTRSEWLERVMAQDAESVRAGFERLLAEPAAVAVAGKVPARATDRLREVLGARTA
jgi:predicted Zn-dependent peptidase